MSLNLETMLAVLGMTLATYACRGGGYWLFRQIKPGPGTRALLGYIPGTLFVSYVAPGLLAGGWEQWVGAAVVLAIMGLVGDISLAIFGGTAAAWAAWALH